MLKCCFFQCSLGHIHNLCWIGWKPELQVENRTASFLPQHLSLKLQQDQQPFSCGNSPQRNVLFFFNKFSFHSHSKTGSEEAYQNNYRKPNQAFYSPFPSTKTTMMCPVVSRSIQMGPTLPLTAWPSWLEDSALDCSLNGARESPSVLSDQK